MFERRKLTAKYCLPLQLRDLHIEKKILKKISGGDQGSFAFVYETCSAAMTRFVMKYVKSEELAKDIVQEVFISIWEKRSVLEFVDSPEAYLFTAARNHTLNFLKKAAREKELKEKILRNYLLTQEQPDSSLQDLHYQKFITSVLNSLPPQTKTIFKMCREEGKSYDEVAAVLDISRSAVKKHIVRSHKVFKEKLLQSADLQLKSLVLLLLIFNP